MRGYARRHYGIDEYRLRDPKVIVQHYTVTNSFAAVYNTFAPNVPDPELNELPGVCAHFVIDRDGTIYQLVRSSSCAATRWGSTRPPSASSTWARSDAQVMGNAAQRAASLRLTRALQGRYAIATRNVIGHNENLLEPLPPRAGRAPANARPTATAPSPYGPLPATAGAAARPGQHALRAASAARTARCRPPAPRRDPAVR